MYDGGEASARPVQQTPVPCPIAFLLPNDGPALFRHGVRQWRRSYVPDSAVRKIQGTSRRVSGALVFPRIILYSHLPHQVLRFGNRNRIILPALARHHLPGLEAGQRSPGRRRTHQDSGLRNVQGEHQRRQDDQDILWHARLHCPRDNPVPAVR